MKSVKMHSSTKGNKLDKGYKFVHEEFIHHYQDITGCRKCQPEGFLLQLLKDLQSHSCHRVPDRTLFTAGSVGCSTPPGLQEWLAKMAQTKNTEENPLKPEKIWRIKIPPSNPPPQQNNPPTLQRNPQPAPNRMPRPLVWHSAVNGARRDCRFAGENQFLLSLALARTEEERRCLRQIYGAN
ncbi:uncharacterized protein LOC144992755 [Oryzias latipes]